jgi:Tol biopolymer transport system component
MANSIVHPREGSMHDSDLGRPGHTTADGSRPLRPLLAGLGTLLAAGALAAPAQAAFPGSNGRVVYERTPNRQLERALAYDRNDGTELWTSDAKGGDLKLLVSFNDRGYPVASAHDPSVSPDGKQVAYVESGTVDSSNPYYDVIHIIGIDGTGDHVLRDDIADGSAPAWSPDGKQIVFVRPESDSETLQLVVTAADGSGTPKVIDTGKQSQPTDPQWSPDGKWIAFDTGESAYVVAASGGEPVRVGDTPDPEQGYVEDTYPNWAPDGTAIILQRVHGQWTRGTGRAATDFGTQLVEVPFEHGAPVNSSETRVVNTDTDPERPAYSPDGLKLLYGGYPPQSTAGRNLAGLSTGTSLLVANADGTHQGTFVSPSFGASLTAADWAPVPRPKPVPQTPPTTPVVVTPAPPQGAVEGETARRCGSRRDFVIRLRPKGVRLVMARVMLRGHRLKVHQRHGRFVAVVDLRSLPKKRFKVDITVWASDGRRFHEVRRYWTCTPAR